ncbi:MAG: hypothetical protein NZ108_09380, partial [Bacteroidia bacterium]|nr:hypothetical protein [Bacteroidia bacterium]
MQKQIVLVWFAISFVISGKGQNSNLWKDSTYLANFSAQSLEWEQWSHQDSEAKLQNGAYWIEHKRSDASWAFWRQFHLDYQQKYTIEAKMTQITGAEEYGHGIIWGFQNWDNFQCFLISPSGNYVVATITDGKYDAIRRWTHSPSIQKNGANTLLISRGLDETLFYINGEKVTTVPSEFLVHAGRTIGFILYNQKQIRIESFQIKGKFAKINSIPNPGTIQKQNLG